MMREGQREALPMDAIISTWTPRLLSVQVSTKTASALTLLVTGYATSRSITQIDVQFAPLA